MRIGIGLVLLPLIGIFLSLIRIPLDWKIILFISITPAAFFLIKNKEKLNFKPKIKKSDIYVFIVILLFLGTFYMYHKGAFAYPYLEDDDPWSHAVGIKFVSIEKTVFMPVEMGRRLQYLHPYPASYDLIFGILHQTSPNLMWTMKYFNALIISLSIIFFYFFVKKFTGSQKRALFSTFALAMIPSFLSHFIWAIALSVPLYFVAFYSIEKIKDNKKWIYISALMVASMLIMTPTHSTYFGFFFILYFMTTSILKKSFQTKLFITGFSGLLISFLLWWGPMIKTYGFKGFIVAMDLAHSDLWSFGGTGDRIYGLGDFIFAQSQNMVNNPVGIGLFLSVLLVLSLLVIFLRLDTLKNEKNQWVIISLVWFAFTLYAVNAARFPVKLSPFRTWMLFAIPLCILVSQGFLFLTSLLKNNLAKITLIILIIMGMWYTSGLQKFELNTSPGWPPGAFWTSVDEVQGYTWLTTLPPNTKVFSYTNEGVIIGYGTFSCVWCDENVEFKKTAINQSANDLHSWLKGQEYEYLVLGGQEAMEYGVDTLNTKVNELASSNLFQPVHQTQSVIFFKLV
jgi:hypothetical protein